MAPGATSTTIRPEQETIMTIHTVTPKHHISVKSAAVGLAGAGIALGAAFGVTAALTGEGTTTAPGQQQLPQVVNTDGAWDSWDRRGNRNSVPGTEDGVRDSWMPPGTTDQG
jgi:hypothetical protein